LKHFFVISKSNFKLRNKKLRNEIRTIPKKPEY
jgi:hypothetical protein